MADETETQPALTPEPPKPPEGAKTESVTLTQAKLEGMLLEANKRGREEAKSQFTGKISQQGKDLADYKRQLEAAGWTREERDRIFATDSWKEKAVEARIMAEGLPQSAKRVLMATQATEDYESAIAELKEDFKGFDAKGFITQQTQDGTGAGRKEPAPMPSGGGAAAGPASRKAIMDAYLRDPTEDNRRAYAAIRGS